MKYYLAYGSNLNLEQMQRRCPTARMVGTAYLENTRLVYRGSYSGSYLSIEPALRSEPRRVPCGVFLIDKQAERALDIYEGYPHFYGKSNYQVTLLQPGCEPRSITAMAYALPTSAPLGLPSKRYVRVCADGYDDFGFDQSVLDQAWVDTCSSIAAENFMSVYEQAD